MSGFLVCCQVASCCLQCADEVLSRINCVFPVHLSVCLTDFWEYCCSDCLQSLQVMSENEDWTKRERARKEEGGGGRTGGSVLVFMASFGSPIHPCLIFFTSHLPFSAANVWHAAGGSNTPARNGAGQPIARTPKQKQAAFNCYMLESAISFSL